jgi:hypothetical protein
MAQVIAVSDSGYEILCKLASDLMTAKMVGGKKTVVLDMTPYNQTQLQKLNSNLQKSLSVTH